jgi:hypothetical protein
VLGDLLTDVRALEADNEVMQAKLGAKVDPSERRPLSIEETDKAHKLLNNARIASGRLPDRILNLVEANKRCEEEMAKAQRETLLYKGQVEEMRKSGEVAGQKKELEHAAASIKEAVDVFDAACLPPGSFAYRLNGLRVNYLSGKAERQELREEIDGAHNLFRAAGFKPDGTLLERVAGLLSTVDHQNASIRQYEAEAQRCDGVLRAAGKASGTMEARIRSILYEHANLTSQYEAVRSERGPKAIEAAHAILNETDVAQGPFLARLTALAREYQKTREDRKILDLFRSALTRTEAR